MRVLSGIQPTGLLHIGNYLGAVKQWINLQDKHDCLFFIVDWHAMTEPYQPADLRKNVFGAALDYLALGLDPKKCIIFVQSQVSEHTELAWILNTITPLGDLQRMTQFKDKAKQFRKTLNAGLLNYPILMAADILLYKTELVPVGEDQLQHIELTRALARKFNKRFGETFVVPKPLVSELGARIMSLDDPTKKMSKSLGEKKCLGIFESEQSIYQKIKRAVTDSGREIKYDLAKKPAISNLLSIFSLISGKEIKELEKEFKGKGYAEFKDALAKEIINHFKPYKKKREKLEKSSDYVRKVLDEGAERAGLIAAKMMKEVRSKIGLL